MSFKVGIIGCGSPGRGQARGHLRGYSYAGCEVVALADIVEENAVAFRDEFNLSSAQIFTDYEEMLVKANPDIVSICLWPHLHAPAVLAAAQAGVRAIHCEKPMAPTWGEAKRMARVCEERGVQLTINHQRRFGVPYQKAKELLKAGAIGKLERLEANATNLFDWGTHWFDMMSFYNDDTPVDWVLGQIEWRGSRSVFGAAIEAQGISHVCFSNGVHGLQVTGPEYQAWGARNRLIGTEGAIEVAVPGADGTPDSIPLRLRNGEAAGWQEIETGEGPHDPACYDRTTADLVESLQTGREPLLSARRALIGTELIFATYESCRRRGRVDLPLTEDDSALLELLRENNAMPEKAITR